MTNFPDLNYKGSQSSLVCSQSHYFLFKVRPARVTNVFEKNEKKNNICLQAKVKFFIMCKPCIDRFHILVMS